MRGRVTLAANDPFFEGVNQDVAFQLKPQFILTPMKAFDVIIHFVLPGTFCGPQLLAVL
jgi:hypothetical protein